MRVLVMQNPRSGFGGLDLAPFLETISSEAELTLREIAPLGDLSRQMSDAAGFDRIVAVGGDGTASAVAHAAVGAEVPILVYPAGTANLLATNLGMPSSPKALAEVLLHGDVSVTDLGEICAEPCRRTADTMGFAVIAGAGFDAKVMQGASELKQTLGAGAYFVSVLMNMTPTPAEFSIELDGTKVEREGIAVLVVNFGKIQFDLSVTHDSDARDGLFEVVVIQPHNVAALIPTVWAALLDRLGDNPDRPSLEVFQARDIRVECEPPLPLQYDGEVTGSTTPFHARMLAGAARFLVPAGTSEASSA